MSHCKTFHDPETCACCEGINKITPMSTANRPGLSALIYRVGTHATFLETMKACLSSACLNCDEEADEALFTYLGQLLTTRSSDDPAIALLDAWATVGDVLTFYQERIANEGYLRTATERLSILELARLVGYKLRPGVSSSVYLAFTLEDEYEVEIPTGTRAQSIPNPGETMESFETAEPLLAHYEWNGMQPRQHRPTYIAPDNVLSFSTLYIDGINNNLRPNDMMLFNFSFMQAPRLVRAVEIQPNESRTKIELQTEPVVEGRAIAQTQEVIASYLAQETSTEMAERVKADLKVLQAELHPQMTAIQFNKVVDNALTQLQAEEEVAIQSNYRRLAPWIGEIIKLLGSVEAQPESRSDIRSLRTRAAFRETSDRDDIITPFETLVEGLLVPPTEQPLTAKRLDRQLGVVYGSNSDIAPNLLTQFNPRLQGALYPAWSNTQVVRPTTLQNVDTFRVKAAPFGHNAPLQPVYDSKGRVVSSREWDIQTFSLELIPENGSSQNITTMQAALTLAHYDTYTKQVNLPAADTTIEVAFLDTIIPFTINTGGSSSPGAVAFIDSIDLQLFDEEINVNPHGEGWEVTIGGNEFSLSSGQKRRVIINEIEYVLTLSEELDHFQLILVPPPPALLAKNILPLDSEVKDILPGSWVLVERPEQGDDSQKEQLIRQVEAVGTISHAGYGLTGKTTTLTLNEDWLYDSDEDFSVIRQTTVYAQSESLTLVDEPMETAVCNSKIDPTTGDQTESGALEIELDDLYEGLETGRWIIVKGERTDIEGVEGVMATERVMIAGVKQGPHMMERPNGREIALPGDTAHTTLQLANNLAYCYKRDTVTIYGNVVKATHGETREEVLGSGDGSQELQAFTLKHHPLTFTSAATASGIESSLTVRVNEVAWDEADNLFSLGPKDRQFITERDNEEKTTITFGDGEHGARLPTAPNNVTAVYRSGIGKPGNVQAEQISLLATQPLGVKEVINPLAASGGADAESRDSARRNAPLAVMALDRLISERDYADFSRTFAGVGKATAARLSNGQREVMHVTIAGADDIPIAIDSDLFENLRFALYQLGDPHLPIQLAVRELAILFIKARVKLQDAYHWEAVEPEIRAVLLDTFSFEKRDLGQDVAVSEVISTIQAVSGVAYVDVDILDAVAETQDIETLLSLADSLTLRTRIPAHTDRIDTRVSPTQLHPSQLIYLLPDVPDTLLLELIS